MFVTSVFQSVKHCFKFLFNGVGCCCSATALYSGDSSPLLFGRPVEIWTSFPCIFSKSGPNFEDLAQKLGDVPFIYLLIF